MAVTKQQTLDYHFGERPGKIEVIPSKPCRTQRDLGLAYTPGVAIPCLEIEKNHVSETLEQHAFAFPSRAFPPARQCRPVPMPEAPAPLNTTLTCAIALPTPLLITATRFPRAVYLNASCAEHYVRLGVKRENITLCDTKGVVYAGRARGHEFLQGKVREEDAVAHAGGGHARGGRFCGLLGEGRSKRGHGAIDGAAADRVCDGQP